MSQGVGAIGFLAWQIVFIHAFCWHAKIISPGSKAPAPHLRLKHKQALYPSAKYNFIPIIWHDVAKSCFKNFSATYQFTYLCSQSKLFGSY